MAAQKVWFILVGASGKARSSASSVRLAREDVDVDDFRDAVYDQVSCALPTTTIASDLRVFASKAAFDQKQPPLEVNSDIEARGLSEHDALVVEVPERRVSAPSLRISAEEIAEIMMSKLKEVLQARDEMRLARSFSELDTEE